MEVDDEHQVQRVILPDGAVVLGEPHVDPSRYAPEQIEAYAERAREHGYDDPWQACVEHDALHQLVAEWLGWSSSLSLWIAAHPVSILRGIIRWEDVIVLSMQRLLNVQPPDPSLGVLTAQGHDLDHLKCAAMELLRSRGRRAGNGG
jgi:hypothetical protein